MHAQLSALPFNLEQCTPAKAFYALTVAPPKIVVDCRGGYQGFSHVPH
jgi:hypothetical protein